MASRFDLLSLPNDLKNKVALITGGGRGIGRGISLKLASLGAKIVVNYINLPGNLENALETKSLIEKNGSEAHIIEADISKSESCNNMVKKTIEKFGRLDVVVNNAGLFLGAPIEQETDEQLRKLLDVNVLGMFFVIRAAVPHLLPNSAIINITSTMAKYPTSGISAYAMTRGATDSFTRALAVELAPKGIRVNAVAPGYVATNMIKEGGDELKNEGVEASLFKRLGTPEDIAETVAFLAVPRSGNFMTGCVLSPSGGVGFTF